MRREKRSLGEVDRFCRTLEESKQEPERQRVTVCAGVPPQGAITVPDALNPLFVSGLFDILGGPGHWSSGVTGHGRQFRCNHPRRVWHYGFSQSETLHIQDIMCK